MIYNLEPLAVNAFETVRGWLKMKANKQRSYDVSAEIVTGNAILSEPLNELDHIRNIPDGFTRRKGFWALHEQTYYFDQPYYDQASKPEYAGLYQAD